MLANLLAVSYELYAGIQTALLIVSVLCAIFVTIVVLIQPSNSNGISAISGGQTDTFYGKNKSQTIESKLRRLTVICLIIVAVLLISYFLLDFLLVV